MPLMPSNDRRMDALRGPVDTGRSVEAPLMEPSRRLGGSAVRYTRDCPEEILLYAFVERHYADFLAEGYTTPALPSWREKDAQMTGLLKLA